MLSIEEIPWYRPSRWLRSFLEWGIWTPVANLSYAIYLVHIFVMIPAELLINPFKSREQMDFEANPDLKVPDGCPFSF